MNTARAWGIARSLVIYYGQPWKRRRMDRLYRTFIAPGELCFDVGSHVGNRVASWRRLGARVVAIEPQPDFLAILHRLFDADEMVQILGIGLAERPGHLDLRISTAAPTVSTFSREWIESVGAHPKFSGVDWDRTVQVEVRTLDQLIAEHGVPAFCKIDVEGFEGAVLRGLTQPLPALSFELLPMARGAGIACVEHLMSLAPYRFRTSVQETMRFTEPDWVDADALLRHIEALPQNARSGDVYAATATRVAHLQAAER